MQTRTESYFPEGRLVPVFCANQDLCAAPVVLSFAKTAAARGETVLMVDCQDGQLMEEAGIIYGKTLADVIFHGADMRDAKYITSNEHFTAVAAGEATLATLLGSLAAFSLDYDWVLVGTHSGCTPDHVRLAGAADYSLMAYDTQSDHFMRAYWMIDAIRRRYPHFDPHILSMGDPEEAAETGHMLTQLVAEFLGARPPYAGHIGQDRTFQTLISDLVNRGGISHDAPMSENLITNNSATTEFFM